MEKKKEEKRTRRRPRARRACPPRGSRARGSRGACRPLRQKCRAPSRYVLRTHIGYSRDRGFFIKKNHPEVSAARALHSHYWRFWIPASTHSQKATNKKKSARVQCSEPRNMPTNNKQTAAAKQQRSNSHNNNNNNSSSNNSNNNNNNNQQQPKATATHRERTSSACADTASSRKSVPIRGRVSTPMIISSPIPKKNRKRCLKE
jgi:hypothetical protein